MIEKTKLEEISSELPEHERRELLARIKRGLDQDAREDVERIELKQEEREKIIAEEIAQASLWERFLLWLKSLLTGRSKRDLFVDTRISQLKRSIRQKNPGISGFETRNLTPKFARQLFDLYSAAFPLRELFLTFSRDVEFREAALNYIFESKYPEAKKELEELAPAPDMEMAFGSGGEEEVRKLVLRRFNDYLKRIPDRLFQQIEEGIKPLIYFRNLTLFPYTLIFRHFNYYPGELLDEKYPYFDHGPAMLMLDLLERLYGALGLVERLGGEWFCHEELLEFYSRYRRGGLEPLGSGNRRRRRTGRGCGRPGGHRAAAGSGRAGGGRAQRRPDRPCRGCRAIRAPPAAARPGALFPAGPLPAPELHGAPHAAETAICGNPARQAALPAIQPHLHGEAQRSGAPYPGDLPLRAPAGAVLLHGPT